MKQIIAIIKPFIAEKVLQALGEAGFMDLTVREVHGYGRQKSYLSEYRQNDFSVVFLPKIEICIWAEESDVSEITDLISKQARTGRMGDGKVFSIDVISNHSSS